MNNNDFDILLRSVHQSAKLQIAKFHKILNKLSVICTRRYGCSLISSVYPKTCKSVRVPFTQFHLSYASTQVENVYTACATEGSIIRKEIHNKS